MGRSLGSQGIRIGCVSRFGQSASRTGPASAPDWLIGHEGSGGSGAELKTLVGPPGSRSNLTGLPQSARCPRRVIWALQLLALCPGSPPPWAVTSDRRDFTCHRKVGGRKSARMRGAVRGTTAAKTERLEGLAASSCRPKGPLDIGFHRSVFPHDFIS